MSRHKRKADANVLAVQLIHAAATVDRGTSGGLETLHVSWLTGGAASAAETVTDVPEWPSDGTGGVPGLRSWELRRETPLADPYGTPFEVTLTVSGTAGIPAVIRNLGSSDLYALARNTSLLLERPQDTVYGWHGCPTCETTTRLQWSLDGLWLTVDSEATRYTRRPIGIHGLPPDPAIRGFSQEEAEDLVAAIEWLLTAPLPDPPPRQVIEESLDALFANLESDYFRRPRDTGE